MAARYNNRIGTFNIVHCLGSLSCARSEVTQTRVWVSVVRIRNAQFRPSAATINISILTWDGHGAAEAGDTNGRENQKW